MARLDNEQPKRTIPGVNIAGDYSTRGTDIAPDEQEPALDRIETIEPQSQGHMSPADAEHMREQREKVRNESLKASSNTQSSFGAEAGKRIVNPSSDMTANTDWPVDE